MFKKIEIWILYLVLLLSILSAIAFGILVRQELVGSSKLGWVSKTALTLAELPVIIKQLMSNDNIVSSPGEHFDVLRKGFNGEGSDREMYLLLSRFDGDINEGVIELIDLRDFKVLHVWNPDIDKFNSSINDDDFKYLNRDKNDSRSGLMHPLLLDNGEIMFHFETPLRKIDYCSNLVFQVSKDKFHHSIEADSQGNIWASSRLYPQSLPESQVGRLIDEEGGFKDDSIVKLSPDGEILFEKSVAQIFIDNGLESKIFSVGYATFDIDPIHLNDIQPVNSDSKFWKKGDLFLSIRNQSMIALYRPATNKIIWTGTGKFFYQHDVNILNDHKISLFNNNAKNFRKGLLVDGFNEMLIYDFEDGVYTSYLHESMIKNKVKTPTQGRGKILENGDMFIEETDSGRTLYFNSDGTLRWTHLNRSDDGKIYRVVWSRILDSENDINNARKVARTKNTCAS